MDIDAASERRRKQNRNAQRTHRKKKKLIELAKEGELKSAIAERDHLLQKLSMYENTDPGKAQPVAMTPPWPRLSHEQADPLHWGKETVEQADDLGNLDFLSNIHTSTILTILQE